MKNEYSQLGNIFFVNESLYGILKEKAQDNIWYGERVSIHGTDTNLPPEQVFLEVSLCCGSDYSGNDITKANFKYMNDKYVGELDGVYAIYGGYDSYGIAIRYDVIESNKEIQDILNGLCDYPVIDEYTHGELVMDIENEYIDTELVTGIIHEIEFRMDEIGLTLGQHYELPERAEVWSDIEERFNQSGDMIIIETGCVPYCREHETIIDTLVEEYIDNKLDIDYITIPTTVITGIQSNSTTDLSLNEMVEAHKLTEEYDAFEIEESCEITGLSLVKTYTYC